MSALGRKLLMDTLILTAIVLGLFGVVYYYLSDHNR